MLKPRSVIATTVVVLLATGCWLGLAGSNQQGVARSPDARPYGLVGDGQADDTAALQTVVDGGVGGIELPKGVYRITKPIVVDLEKVGVTSFSADGTATLLMDGPGPAIDFRGSHGGTANPKTVKPEVWQSERTPRVTNLEIVGNHPEADGIRADGTMQLSVHGVTLRKLRHGIRLVGRNRNFLASACHIYENSGVGIFYDAVNLHQSNVVGCHISYCGGGGIVCRGGEVRNLQIGTCDIEGCMDPDGPPTANILIDCTDGSTAEVTIVGCTIQHADVPGSANIRLIGLGKGRGGAQRWGHTTIGDNALSDVQVNLDVRDCRGVTITGNTFWSAYEQNIKIEKSEQVVIGPNVLERNPAYSPAKDKATNSVLIRECRDFTITGLHLHDVRDTPAAMTLDNCQRVNMNGCTLLDCTGTSLLLNDCRHCQVTGFMIRNDTENNDNFVPVKVEGGEGNRVDSNLSMEARD